MPRDGSGIMSWPPNTTAIPNTTIQSGKYNAFLADLLADLNAARPITAGGTGAVTAVDANDKLNTVGANIASAATTDLSAATGVYLTITGAAAITSFGNEAAGAERVLTFAGAATLTHNAASLILPGAANIVTAAGDTTTMRSLGGGNWRCIHYQRAGNAPFTPNYNGAFTASGNIQSGPSGTNGSVILQTGSSIEVGAGRTADGFAFIDLSAVVGADFNFRIIRNAGANGTVQLTNTGTGDFQLAGGGNLTWNSSAVLTAASGRLQKFFESAQQTITNSGLLTLAHGLGAQPKLFLPVIICQTAEGGYSAGDEVMVNPTSNEAGSNRGLSVVPDATNMNIRFGGNPFQITRKDTGAFLNTTNANWRFVIRAWL